MSKFFFDSEKSIIINEQNKKISLDSPEAFNLISEAWLRTGWDTKYVYSFSWLGRPIIQLPEDLIRIQEIIFELKPDLIIETGIAHGGSLIFYSHLCSVIGKGKVIGIDIDIREHNRLEIENHKLYPFIEMIEGSSTDPKIIEALKPKISTRDKVLVILDSNHSKKHVKKELELYSPLVSKGSYIVACDGIMKNLSSAPRSEDDWDWNNPISAIDEFVENNKNFKITEPKFPFNEGKINDRVTYWPKAFLKRID